MVVTTQAMRKAAQALQEADAVLIGAGAGMSIPAGIDLNDRAAFAREFPAMVKYGFEYGYQLLGYPYRDDRLRWGYLASSLMKSARLGEDPTYQKLKSLVADKDYFVLTTNVDRLFHKNQFDPERIYTPQGDSFLLQCKTPCTNAVWDGIPILEKAEWHVDPETQYLTSEEFVPRCPHCGGEVYMNVRSGMFYIDAPYQKQQDALNQWLDSRLGQKIVLLEIGVGFNTPGVIRAPFEHLAQSTRNVRLVRINKFEAEGPHGAISVAADIAEALTTILDLTEGL